MRRSLVAAALALVTLSVPTGVLAQDAPASDDGLRPQLGPHRFIPGGIVRDPFPRTYVRNSLGIGTAQDLPIIPTFILSTGDTIQGVTGNLLFALLDFEYQQRIKDWMSFWVDVNVRGRLGDDVGALLAEGITLSTGFEIGWLFKLLESNRTALSATAQVRNNSLTGVNIFDYLKGIIDSVDVPLVQKTPVLRVGGALRFAWAANEWLGVTASGGAEYGETADRSEANSASGVVGLATDVDFGPLINAPVGIVLSGQVILAPDRTLQDIGEAWIGALRIAYTGRPDFVIALDMNIAQAPLRDITVTSTTTRISMRYYF